MNFDDLFGGGEKSAPSPKWDNIGDAHVGVITGEPRVEQETEFGTRKPKWFVKVDGKWKVMLDGEFDRDGTDHFPVTEIVVPVKLENGSDATFRLKSQRKDALKQAMKDSGLPLEEGVTIGVKLERTERTSFGGQKKIYSVKLAR